MRKSRFGATPMGPTIAAVFIVIGLLSGIALTNQSSAVNPGAPPLFFRQFYLTTTTHDGDEALTACAPGFHMASMWEILDPSNLSYNTELGLTADDSGSGPPNDLAGWVRTGNNAGTFDSPGGANCDAWDSDEVDDRGTMVELVQSSWGQGERENAYVQPWQANTRSCSSPTEVWCVEDLP